MRRSSSSRQVRSGAVTSSSATNPRFSSKAMLLSMRAPAPSRLLGSGRRLPSGRWLAVLRRMVCMSESFGMCVSLHGSCTIAAPTTHSPAGQPSGQQPWSVPPAAIHTNSNACGADEVERFLWKTRNGGSGLPPPARPSIVREQGGRMDEETQDLVRQLCTRIGARLGFGEPNRCARAPYRLERAGHSISALVQAAKSIIP